MIDYTTPIPSKGFKSIDIVFPLNNIRGLVFWATVNYGTFPTTIPYAVGGNPLNYIVVYNPNDNDVPGPDDLYRYNAVIIGYPI